MSDKYQAFTSSAIGKFLATNLGLPQPARLERYTPGDPLVKGTVVVGGNGRLAESLGGILETLGIESTDQVSATATEGGRFKGLVFDATNVHVYADSRLVEGAA